MDANTYLTESARTTSDGYHTENMEGDLSLPNVLAAINFTGGGTDEAKRRLFYNKKRTEPELQAMLLAAESLSQRELSYEDIDKDILHAVLGISSEVGEIAEAICTKDPVDLVNLREEAGDLLWYVAMLLRTLGTDFETEMERNINKLRVRFPDKFTQQDAAERDLEAERQALEA